MLRSLLLFFCLIINKNIFCQVATNRLPIVWEKSFGGSCRDRPNDIALTQDSGYIVVGSSCSNDRDVTGHHGSQNSDDGWVVKIDGNGSLKWQRSVGGSNDDVLTKVIVSPVGNYYCFGYTNSVDGDVSSAPGVHKTWVIELSAAGDLIWSKTYDTGYAVIVNAITTSDEKMVVVGSGRVLKIDTAGNVLWQKSFGSWDAKNIVETSDHQLVVSGGYQFNLDTGDTTNLHWNFSSEFRESSMKILNGNIFILYEDFVENLCPSSGVLGNIVNRIGHFNGIAGDFSYETWHENVCADGGRYGGAEVHANTVDGLALPQNGSFVAAGKLENVYSGRSVAAFYYNGKFNLYGVWDDGYYSEFNSVKILPGENEFICTGYTNNNFGDFSENWTGGFLVVKLATIHTSIWTGIKNMDWNDIENWDTKIIPGIGTMIIIPAGVPNFPVVKSNVSCYSLQVDSSATITVNEGYHLEIVGKH
jgi:hypothetical protein